MDALELLKNDHRQLETLFGQIRAESSAEHRRDLFQQLQTELTVHAQLEEAYFYPALQDFPETAEHVRKSRDEHARMDEILQRLSEMDPASEPWSQQLAELENRVSLHVADEEHRLFPATDRLLSVRSRLDLGARMQHRKETGEDAGGAPWSRAELRGAAERWAGVASEKGKQVFSEQSHRAGEQLHGLANALYSTTEQLNQQGQEALSRYLDQFAGQLDEFSTTLRDSDPDRLAQRTMEQARRQPALFFGGAVAAGFLISRFLKSSDTRTGIQ